MSGNDAFTKVLMHFDGNANDDNLGGGPHTWNNSGSVNVSSTAKFGTFAAGIPNSGTAVIAWRTPSNTDFDLGTGDFTIDFWACVLKTTPGAVMCGRRNSAGTVTGWSMSVAAGGPLGSAPTSPPVASGLVNTSGGGFKTVNTPQAASDPTGYHHYALVRTGNTLKMAMDGVFGTPITISGSILDTGAPLAVGRWGDYTSANGTSLKVDEFRISVGSARWTTDFTPPVAAYSFEPGATILNAAVGEYSYLGKTVSYALTRAIVAARGTFAYTGNAATLIAGSLFLLASTGAYALTGKAITMALNGHLALILLAGKGSYLWTSVANYLLRAIFRDPLGDPPSLQKTRRNPPKLDM